MSRLIYYTALLTNSLAVLALIYFMLNEAHGGGDFFIIAIAMLPPLFSLMAVYERPDWEQRKLERQVHKARLRKELKELEG